VKRAVVVLPGTQVSPPSIQEESTGAVARDAEVVALREDVEVVVLREDAEVAVPGGCVELVAPREDAEVAVLGDVDGNDMLIIIYN